MGENTRSIPRRKVLQGIGISSVSSVGFTTTGNAASDRNYSGFIYNPKNFEIIDESNARLNTNMERLSGSIDVGEYTVDLAGNSPRRVEVSGDSTICTFRKTGDRRKKGEKYKRLVEISATDTGWLTGYVRGTNSLERRGIVLVSDSKRRRANAEKFLRELQGGR